MRGTRVSFHRGSGSPLEPIENRDHRNQDRSRDRAARSNHGQASGGLEISATPGPATRGRDRQRDNPWELGRWEDAIAVHGEVMTRYGDLSDPQLAEQVAQAMVNRWVCLEEPGRRAPGGRMATRTVGDARFDHGAQHFSVRS